MLDAFDQVGAYVLDLRGHVMTWNTGAARLTGYSREEMLGAPLRRLLAAEEEESGGFARMLSRVREDGEYRSEGYRLRKDGSRFLATSVCRPVCDRDGKLIAIIETIRDVAKHEGMRQMLRKSERQFSLLVQSVVDYAIFMLDLNGKVSTWNSGAQRIKGYTTGEIVGRHFSIFYTEEDRRAGLPQKLLATSAREGRAESEGWRVRKDGTRFFASVVIDAVRDERGELVGFGKVTRDVTERKEAEERLEQTRVAFVQAQKMEALGQLTGGVAHDFNNLLTVILSNADLLNSPSVDIARRGKLVEGILRAASRGATLTQQLLAFARRQPLRPKRHRINALIGAFEAVLRRACGEACEVSFELTPGPTTAEIDESQFEAALLNLVVNARDAMPDGGRITVRTRIVDIDAWRAAQMDGVTPGKHIALSIEDDGAGIPPAALPHVFEPFFTTKEAGKGSGLGLSQVFGFAKQSDGHAEIDSEVGKGTVVTLYLPLRLGTPAVEEEARKAPRPFHAKRGTVLIVEDDPDVLESAIASFKSIGYDVLTAENGVAALEIMRRNQPFDLLFSDVVMPKGMSGIDLARAARELRPGLKVLLASGYPRAVAGANDPLDEFPLIGKPYRLDDLAERLRGLMAEV